MAADITARPGSPPLVRRLPTFGLSWRILGLVIAAILTAELLLFLPSIGRYRLVYLEQLIESGTLAALALDAALPPPPPTTPENKKKKHGHSHAPPPPPPPPRLFLVFVRTTKKTPRRA